MKNLILFFSTLAVVLLSTSKNVAQNWKDVDPKTVSTLVDNHLVQAFEVTLLPGAMDHVHTHSAHFFYALSECHLLIHYTDGKEEKYDLAAGDNGYSDPERPHWTQNVGDKPAKFLVIELKEHPYKSMKNK